MREELARVAAAYARLETLTVQMVSKSETETDGGRQTSEQRSQAWYVKPDRVRIEHSRMITVLNGDESTTYFAVPRRYGKTSIAGQPQRRPGSFQPEYPGSGQGQVVLFDRIAERVVSAEAAGETIRVTYEESPLPAHVSFSPVSFWVDPETHLISRMECTVSHRRPDTEEVVHKKQTTLFQVRIDEPISPEIFEYTPPPDAVLMQSGAIGASGR